MNAATAAGSFTPGRISTPLATSTPSAPVAAIAAATLIGVSPPASKNGRRARRAINAHGAATPAAAEAVDERVVEPQRRRPARLVVERRFVAHANHADDLRPGHGRERRRRLVAVKLRAVQRQLVDPARDLVSRRADEHADLQHPSRNRGDHTLRVGRRDESLRPRPQVDADRVGACRGRHRRVLGRGHAADLHERGRHSPGS